MDHHFKEPYNLKYFFGFLVAMLLPTLPASLTWLGILSH
ncbi:membrane protein [Photobacterium galatheae]|uniref:Membrane protein n=1 Tax=Photobacterium galatheae TaxID=1654360 RepID=A0A066RZW9_9GAMM|nr:membrane protein [Photobacterium galatheae]